MVSLRLRTHIFIYLSIITLVLSVVFIYISTSRFSKQAMASLHEYGESMALDSAILATDYFLTEDYGSLQQFVEEFTKTNNGKAFFTGLQGLGDIVFTDYAKNKRKRM